MYATVVAEAGQYFCWYKPVMWPTQASIFADANQWCGQRRPVFLLTQVNDVADAGQWHMSTTTLSTTLACDSKNTVVADSD